MFRRSFAFFIVLSSFVLVGCSRSDKGGGSSEEKPNPLVHHPLPQEPKDKIQKTPIHSFVVRGARILNGAGRTIESGYLHVENGKIKSLGEGDGPDLSEEFIVEAYNKVITPGIIDSHSHIGVYPNPSAGVEAHADGNEATGPNTAEVWAEHGFWPQDPSIWRVVAGGVTTIQVLPGSANLFGGRTYTTKLKPGMSSREMRFPAAPHGFKMACGENPKRVYGNKGGPASRMGNVAGFRKSFQKAFEYREKWEKYERDLAFWKKRVSEADGDKVKLKKIGDPPTFKRDLKLETLVKVIKGEIEVHNHCYRADEMSVMIDLSKEFGFKISSFHHATSAYKIAPLLAEKKITVSTWTDWWGFKMEALDAVPQSPAILTRVGVDTIVHSDSETDLRYMFQEVAKAVQAGRKIGLNISESEAVKWVTSNPALAMKISERVGSLQPGKMADFVIWDRSPFSVYAKAEKVFIDGEVYFDRRLENFNMSDFEIGLRDYGLADGRKFSDFSELPKPLSMKEVSPQDTLSVFDPVHGSFVITGVSEMHLGNGRILKGADIHIEKGKIKQIGKSLKVGKKTKKVSGEGLYLTPGLIEVDSNMGLYEVSYVKSSVDSTYDGRNEVADFRVSDSFNPLSNRIAIERSEGVTRALISPRGTFVHGLSYLIDLKNRISSKPSNDPLAMFMSLSWWAAKGNGKSRSGLWMRMREIISDVRTYRRNKGNYLKRNLRKLSLTENELEAFLPILRGEKPLVIVANRATDIRAALSFQKEMRKSGDPLRIAIEGGREAWIVANDLKKSKVDVWLKPSHQEITDFDSLRVRDDLPAYLAAKGVNVVIKSGSNRLRQEAGIAMSYGMKRADAMKAITLNAAKTLGIHKTVGSLSVGKKADLVLWSGDPFEPLSFAKRLWIDGEEMSLENRQLMLARKYARKHGMIE